jgi:hypothetical protein
VDASFQLTAPPLHMPLAYSPQRSAAVRACDMDITADEVHLATSAVRLHLPPPRHPGGERTGKSDIVLSLPAKVGDKIHGLLPRLTSDAD